MAGPHTEQMAPVFFLSHSAPRAANPVRHVFNDLSTHVAVLLGAEPGYEPGFLDPETIPGGGRFADDITKALRTAQVFLPLLSQALLRSGWCGKEWNAFSTRKARSLREDDSPDDHTTPTILPVLWSAIDMRRAPGAVTEIQVFEPHNVSANVAKQYKSEGLYGLLVNPATRDGGDTIVWRLAQRIVELYVNVEVEPGSDTPLTRYSDIFREEDR